MMRSAILLLFLSATAFAGEPSLEELSRLARERLAPISGELKAPGLKERVEVIRDKWGVPHIYAKNQDDLFFTQGFVAAQDRLFQLEMWRRHAAGEMAELLGDSAVESDRFARLIRYRGDMKEEWNSYSPDTRQIAIAFTKGINACIDRFGDKLPIEFDILKFKPKRWQPEDILTRMSGIYMTQNLRNEAARAKLVALFGIEKTRKLAPVDPPCDYGTTLSTEDLAEMDEAIAGFKAATKLLNYKPPKTESNNWVVSGDLSASGKPLLASDPHRALAVPALRYLVHLNAPGWNVIGAGEPALPGVALGHNDRIAWGITIVGVDQTDVVVHETDETGLKYKLGERWVDLKEDNVEIRVKGRETPLTFKQRFTLDGPVLHQNPKRHRIYVLKWAGTQPGGAAYLGGLAVARASDRRSFLKALDSWKVPGLNFVYGDVEGNIGWVAHAASPRRTTHDGLLPVRDDAGWDGFLSVAEEPQSWNPKSGWLGTANHNILPAGYKPLLGFEFAPPYRFQRVEAGLNGKKGFTLKDFAALQHDDVSIPGQTLARLLREEKLSPELKDTVERLTAWDGSLAVDSRAGSLFAVWLRELQTHFYGRHVMRKDRENVINLSGLPVMLKALQEADPFWLGEDAKAGRRDLFEKSLQAALRNFEKLPKEKQDRWGALHVAAFDHPLAAMSPEHAKLFALPAIERGGDSQTPLNTRYDEKYRQIHGATYRQLFDLADWDRGLATSAPGQSGQPGSPHYGDLLPLWGRGEYFPLFFSRAKVEEAVGSRLRMVP